ncbi:pyridoxal phosphate-dependent aminotransferase [Clostridium malenominatum]|uniref:cysteine-S-conjugate beta-lyase n=1 Tax=Clostridium malenominatum TaxID=1539 RepID=A0ABP3UES9_9CLOT
MKYNFDEIIDRRNVGAVKWKGYDEIIPMWVADMDFKAPEEIIEAIKSRADEGTFGYTYLNKQYYNAIINWVEKRHGFKIEKNWIYSTPTIVSALYWLIQTFTEVGDKIIIQTPVYHRFKGAIEDNGRMVLENPLKELEGKYYMDFENLESNIDSKVKMIILCNPHNPVGRVWSKEELIRLGEICLKNNILVVSDEIHSDITFKGYKHTPFASLGNEFAENSITCISPTKTFNLAGIQVSNIIIPNENLRKKFDNTMKLNAMGDINIFGIIGLIAAYEKGEQWYREMLYYIEENYNYMREYIEKNMPMIKVTKLEGTYLAWVDFRALRMNSKELKRFLSEEVKVAFNEGQLFGGNGEGFQRINFACPRKILEEALFRLNIGINNCKTWSEDV